MIYNAFMPTKLIFGPGSLNLLHKQTFPGKKALLVTSSGKSLQKNGSLDRVLAELALAEIEVVMFAQITPNPERQQVADGVKVLLAEQCEFVIGFGGGSSIDAAKAIALMAVHDGDLWDYLSPTTPVQRKIFSEIGLPVVAITTTAGTGTEADPWFVITKPETAEKIGSGNEWTYPIFSIIDPELMLSVPPHLTLYQGFDALCHVMEGYLNALSNPIADLYAKEAITLIGANLAEAVKHGDNLEARTAVALANTLAGMNESISGCISEHSLEHAMSGANPMLPHGAGLMMIMRSYFDRLISKARQIATQGDVVDVTLQNRADKVLVRSLEMAKMLGKSDATKPEELIEALTELMESTGAYTIKMTDYVDKENLKDLVANARATMAGLFAVDPLELSDDDCLAIFNDALLYAEGKK